MESVLRLLRTNTSLNGETHNKNTQMFAQGSLLPPGCLNMLTNEGFCCFAVTVLYFAFSALTLLVWRQGVRESYASYIDAARGRALCNDMVSARLSVCLSLLQRAAGLLLWARRLGDRSIATAGNVAQQQMRAVSCTPLM